METEKERKKRLLDRGLKAQEEFLREVKIIGEKLKLKREKRKKEEEEREIRILACFGLKPSDYAPMVNKKKKKLEKNENKRKKTNIEEEFLDDSKKANDIEKLKDTAPNGLKGLSQTGLDYFLVLFKLIHIETNPNFPGHKGTGDKISCFAKLSEMEHFINNFDLAPLETYWVKTTTKHFPNTGKEYPQYVWTFKEMDKFQTFINSFSNVTPSTEIVWLEDMIQSGNFIRIDNPSTSEYSYVFKNDEESMEKKDKLYKERFPSGLPVMKKLSIVVGSVPHSKKRISNAKLIYTLNLECPGHNRINTGKLKLLFNYELQENCKLLGEAIEGESKLQEDEKEKPKNKNKRPKEKELVPNDSISIQKDCVVKITKK